MFTKNTISVAGILMSLIFHYSLTFGQQNKIWLTAIAIDTATNQPLEFISVSLNTNEFIFVGQTLTKIDGSFQFLIEVPGNYRITLSAIGYAPRTIEFTAPNVSEIALGKIGLFATNTSLATVSITANKPLVKQEIDRLSYDLQADPESKSSSVLEMMRKVPMLSVDGNDNLELKGSSSYRILVNGRPSAMMDRNLKEVLRNMPASTIQKIEVITTPPSKYDAEGLAGIINIITNKKLPAGYSGTLNGYFTAPTGGPGGGGSFSARIGKFGITAFGGGGIYNTPSTFDYNNRVVANTILSQQNQKERNNKSAYSGTEISYEIDSLRLLSASFNLSGSKENGFTTQLSSSAGQIIQQYFLENANNGIGDSQDAALNYQLGSAKNKNRLLTFSYRYYAYNYDNQSQVNFSQQTNDNQPNFKQFNQGSSAEHSAQVDYVTKLKKVGIEAGIKGIFRANNSDFRNMVQNVTSNEFDPDPLRSNQFDNTQDVYAAYNTYQFRLGSFELKTGARLEYTRIAANFKSNQTEIAATQLNLLPAVAISRQLNPSATLTLGFTQRIQRPGIYQLNPFVDRSNPNVETSGNPNLHPVIANGIQLGYSLQKKFFLNISLDYTFFNSLINQVAVYNPATNITRSSYQNTGTAKLLGTNISLNYPVTKKLNFSTNSKLFYGRIEGLNENNAISTGGLMYSIGLNSTYKFKMGWRANAGINYKSRSFTLQREINSITSSSFSLSKDIISSKLSFSLVANNPFNKYRTNVTLLTGPGFEQIMSNIAYFRSSKISINYSFGKLSQAVKKTTRTIRNDDVSN